MFVNSKKIYDLCRKKLWIKKMITTEQMLEALKNDPDNEHEYNLAIAGGVLRSTHWFVYDTERQLFGHTRDWPYNWFSESELLEYYEGCKWMRYA